MGGSKATFKGNKEVGLHGFPDQGNQQPGPKPFGDGGSTVSTIFKGASEIAKDRGIYKGGSRERVDRDTPPIFRGGGSGPNSWRDAMESERVERDRYRQRKEMEMDRRRESQHG